MSRSECDDELAAGGGGDEIDELVMPKFEAHFLCCLGARLVVFAGTFV